MRYRKLDPSGDYTFGQGANNFLVNSPAAVAQAIQTALLLFQGEWFLDVTQGVPYLTQVIGTGTQPNYDTVLKQAILGVGGGGLVTSIVSYSSSLNHATRVLTIAVTVDTIFGQVQVSAGIPTQGGFGFGGFGEGGFGT